MHLLIQARSGGLIIRTDGDGKCAMELSDIEVRGETVKGLCLAGESMRRGMLSYILGETRRIHTSHDSPPLFDDPMREAMLARMKVRVTREPFCHTVFGQYSSKVLPSKVRIDDFGWRYANKLIAHLRPALTKVTGKESLGDVNATLQDALSVSQAKQRKFFMAVKKKEEGKELRESEVNALRYKDELEMIMPRGMIFDPKIKIEGKFLDYFHAAVQFVFDGFAGKRIPVSEMHFELLKEIERLCGDPAWRRELHAVKTTKFSIIPYPVHTAQWIDIPEGSVYYVRGAPLTFATCDFDLLVPNLSEEEERRVRSGPMSCFYGKWGTGFVELLPHVDKDSFHMEYPHLSKESLQAAGVEFPRS
jgi:hypothetical protein